MRCLPATLVSTTLQEPLNWPNATVVSGDAVDVVTRLKEESEVPLRSHGSLSMNRALMAASLVDLVRDALPSDHRSDRGGPDLPGCGRLRPRADREPDTRRQHPRAHLPTHPACLSPTMHPTRQVAERDPAVPADRHADRSHGRPGHAACRGQRRSRVGAYRVAKFARRRLDALTSSRGTRGRAAAILEQRGASFEPRCIERMT
jgi:hypothetical protein